MRVENTMAYLKAGSPFKIARQAVWAASLLAAIVARPSFGLIVVAASNPAEETPTAFAVQKEDSKTIDKLEDFDRYAAKKSWELAFRTLASIEETDGRGMIPGGNGFLYPTSRRVMQSLISLPPEGKEAFRLFNDAKAKQLFAAVQDPTGIRPAEEIPTLRKIASQFLITSVGDLAADRLGDAYFEKGDFGGAEAIWRSILRDCPDTRLSAVKLQVKRCVALARLERREDLAQLVSSIRTQYAGQTVTIGGQEVVAADYAQSLLATPSQTRPAPPDALAAETVLLPTAEKPLWQIRVAPAGTLERMESQIRNSGWGSNGIHYAGTVTPTAIDEQRIYLNWFGIICAADLKTGKLLWRTGKVSDVQDKAMTMLQYGIDVSRFTIGAAGGKVFGVRSDLKNPGNGSSYQLECFDPESGKVQWKGGSGLVYLSMPYLADGSVYAVTASGDTLNLIALNMRNGQPEWQVALGKCRSGNNYRGGLNYPAPKLMMINGTMFVATDNGALLAVNLTQRRIEWALQHDTRPGVGGERVFWNDGSTTRAFETPGTLLLADGTLFLKDKAARLLYAVDPLTPAVVWKRPVSSDEMVFAIADRTAYLLGHDLSALDIRSQKLLWSTRIPSETDDLRPLLANGHIYVLTARGIYDVDARNGDILRIFRGANRDAAGGKLFLSGDKLVCVSDTAVTAYSIQRGAAPVPAKDGH